MRAPGSFRPTARGSRLVVCVCALLWCGTAPARADWLITPHLGWKFGGDTNFVDLEDAARERKAALGLAFGWLGQGVLGAEVDITLVPNYFDREERPLVTSSSVRTVMGSLVVATPLSLTKESLRPYVVGGIGLLRASSEDLLNVFSFESNTLGMNVGGGAIGFVSDGFGVRLDLRYFRNLTSDRSPGIDLGVDRLSYWRAGFGLVFRY